MRDQTNKNEDKKMKQQKFQIGEKVNYTNSNGVFWGERTIIGVESWYGDDCRYFIDPTDTPWFSVDERNLSKI